MNKKDSEKLMPVS